MNGLRPSVARDLHTYTFVVVALDPVPVDARSLDQGLWVLSQTGNPSLVLDRALSYFF